MGKFHPDPLDQVQFRCGFCTHGYTKAPHPDRITEDPDRPWHPWHYYDICPKCGHKAEQSGRERGLLKAWAHATGPKTEEGKAAVTANLDGHPTPEEARRTRYNALKHGLYAESATYFPARPGKYPHCTNCHYYGAECIEPHLAPIEHDNPEACLHRTELYMRHHAAFESGDPSALMGIRASTQATLQAILNDMLLAVIARGVELVNPEWYFDPEAKEFRLVQFEDPDSGRLVTSFKVSANPLLKQIMDWTAKNNLTMADLGMTPKVQQDSDTLQGYLDRTAQREDATDYADKMLVMMGKLGAMVARSREHLDSDPVLLEHKASEGG